MHSINIYNGRVAQNEHCYTICEKLTLFSSLQRNLFELLSVPVDCFGCCFVFLSYRKKIVTVGWDNVDKNMFTDST